MEKFNRPNPLRSVIFAAFIISSVSLYYNYSTRNMYVLLSPTKEYLCSIFGLSNSVWLNESSVVKNNQNQIQAQPVEVNTHVDGEADSHPCRGKYVYVHNLPSKFNTDLLKHCKTLSLWTNMCAHLVNGGLGPQIENWQGVFPDKGWFNTNQFALELIFHNRMKHYKCLTKNSSLASAIYVPFYAGLDVGRYLWGFNASIRDSTPRALVQWLTSTSEWKVLGGRDHFVVAGRIMWDFIRVSDDDADWGNKFMLLPEAKNMSMLVIESSHEHKNGIAIPYPTYFHPSTHNEVFQWQERMTKQKKLYLFSFAGAPRPNQLGSIRDLIIDQCRASNGKCKLLDCQKDGTTCNRPSSVMKLFQKSIFCLQPPGDSFTRRSAFDSILAGCIPVFFNRASAYTQYIWHLPQNHAKYSVFIPEKDIRNGEGNIEKTLNQIPEKEVKEMRKEVIKLIPNLIYADPRSRIETLEDAFDIVIKRVIQRVNEVRQNVTKL